MRLRAALEPFLHFVWHSRTSSCAIATSIDISSHRMISRSATRIVQHATDHHAPLHRQQALLVLVAAALAADDRARHPVRGAASSRCISPTARRACSTCRRRARCRVSCDGDVTDLGKPRHHGISARALPRQGRLAEGRGRPRARPRRRERDARRLPGAAQRLPDEPRQALPAEGPRLRCRRQRAPARRHVVRLRGGASRAGGGVPLRRLYGSRRHVCARRHAPRHLPDPRRDRDAPTT